MNYTILQSADLSANSNSVWQLLREGGKVPKQIVISTNWTGVSSGNDGVFKILFSWDEDHTSYVTAHSVTTTAASNTTDVDVAIFDYGARWVKIDYVANTNGAGTADVDIEILY